jgi:hypothetical protein
MSTVQTPAPCNEHRAMSTVQNHPLQMHPVHVTQLDPGLWNLGEGQRGDGDRGQQETDTGGGKARVHVNASERQGCNQGLRSRSGLTSRWCGAGVS